MITSALAVPPRVRPAITPSSYLPVVHWQIFSARSRRKQVLRGVSRENYKPRAGRYVSPGRRLRGKPDVTPKSRTLVDSHVHLGPPTMRVTH